MTQTKTTPEQREKRLGGVTGKGFLPGQSGNPDGRPRTATFSEVAREIMVEQDPKKRKTKARLLVEKAYFRAMRGSARHLEILLERTEGRVKQAHEISGPDSGPLRFLNMSHDEIQERIAELLLKRESQTR